MAEPKKHTIYIDVDDEITAIIDKVKSAPGRIVALVLPKRATVLQSIVNMKLLKKSATQAKKSLVLITSEAGLLPLAGAVGIHVAKSLQSKPEIPAEPRVAPETEEAIDADIDQALREDEPKLDKTKSIGALAAASAQAADEEETETIELDEADGDTPAAQHKKPRKTGKKGFKVPNFDRFRLSFFLAILAVFLLVFGWIMAEVVVPKATVTIKTDTSTNLSTLTFTANTGLKDLDVSQGLVPATQEEVKKTDTEKTTATGKKDNGTKATGTITIRNCEDSSGRSLPAGTTFTASGKNFLSNEAASVPAGTFSGGGTNCTSSPVSVDVTAADNGDSYNLGAATYTTSSSALQGNFRITGSAMTGGTSKVVTVVAQSDVDAAVAKMKGRLDADAKKELNDKLQAVNLKSLDETLTISEPVITASPAVGSEASGDVTVTAVTTYDILGVKASDLSQLIKKDAAMKIDTSKQAILDDGLNAATIHLTTRKSATEVQLELQALVTAGPQLDANAIKAQIIGKKKGDARELILAKPGVKDVDISYSPFWVYSTPRAAKKINVVIEKPAVQPAGSQTTNGRTP